MESMTLEGPIVNPASGLDLTAFASRPVALLDRTAPPAAADPRGPRPGWEDGEGSSPTPEDEAYYLGLLLGLEGEHPRPAPGTDPAVARAFHMGRLAGFILSPEGLAWREDMRLMRDEIARRLAIEAMYETPEDRASDGERMEAMGSAAFPWRNDWD